MFYWEIQAEVVCTGLEVYLTVIRYFVGNSDIGLYDWFSVLFEQNQTGLHIAFNSVIFS
jgi:hypothetical protein